MTKDEDPGQDGPLFVGGTQVVLQPVQLGQLRLFRVELVHLSGVHDEVCRAQVEGVEEVGPLVHVSHRHAEAVAEVSEVVSALVVPGHEHVRYSLRNARHLTDVVVANDAALVVQIVGYIAQV